MLVSKFALSNGSTCASRYDEEMQGEEEGGLGMTQGGPAQMEARAAGLKHEAGLYKMNALHPQLATAWLQPLSISNEKTVSTFAFTIATCTATTRLPSWKAWRPACGSARCASSDSRQARPRLSSCSPSIRLLFSWFWLFVLSAPGTRAQVADMEDKAEELRSEAADLETRALLLREELNGGGIW
jgi:hypothetical protein